MHQGVAIWHGFLGMGCRFHIFKNMVYSPHPRIVITLSQTLHPWGPVFTHWKLALLFWYGVKIVAYGVTWNDENLHTVTKRNSSSAHFTLGAVHIDNFILGQYILTILPLGQYTLTILPLGQYILTKTLQFHYTIILTLLTLPQEIIFWHNVTFQFFSLQFTCCDSS